MADQSKQRGLLYTGSWRQKLGVAVAILAPLTVVAFQGITWLSRGTWPPLSLLILLPEWLSAFLQLTWLIHPEHSGFRPHDIWIWFVTWLMDVPLSVLLLLTGFLLFIWDEASAPLDGRPVT